MRSKESSFIPLYKKLYEQYKNAILTQQYPPGEKIDSINQIQQRFSVSRETAKIVLRKLAEEGLIVQKAGKGSFISDLGPRKAIWGVIVPFFSAQIEKVISELYQAANEENRTLDHYVSHNSWQEEIRLVGKMINERYEAVIIMPTFDETKTSDFYQHLVSGGTVVTLLDHTMTGSYFTYAIQSYDLGVNRASRYLCKKCSNNLAFVKNDIWAGRNLVLEFMEETFKHFIELECPERKALVLDNVNKMDQNFLDQNNIGGIFCCDDLDAVRVVGKLKEWGYSLPDDISLISYGNTDLAKYFTPQITSIDSHCEEMVTKTVDIIHAHLDGKDVRYCQYVVQPELIERLT